MDVAAGFDAVFLEQQTETGAFFVVMETWATVVATLDKVQARAWRVVSEGAGHGALL
jgi:hypothetical protein